MVKDYSKQGSHLTPGMVSEQAGPVSYRCRLGDGNIIKRHQDQIQTQSLLCPVLDPGIDQMPPRPVLPVETLCPPYQAQVHDSDR